MNHDTFTFYSRYILIDAVVDIRKSNSINYQVIHHLSKEMPTIKNVAGS